MGNKIKFYFMMYSLMIDLADDGLFQTMENVYCICNKNIAWILNYLLKAKGIKVWLCSEELIRREKGSIHGLKKSIFIVEEHKDGELTGILEEKGVRPENIFVIPVRLNEAEEIV